MTYLESYEFSKLPEEIVTAEVLRHVTYSLPIAFISSVQAPAFRRSRVQANRADHGIWEWDTWSTHAQLFVSQTTGAFHKHRSKQRKKGWIEQTIVLAPTKLKPAVQSCWAHFRGKATMGKNSVWEKRTLFIHYLAE